MTRFALPFLLCSALASAPGALAAAPAIPTTDTANVSALDAPVMRHHKGTFRGITMGYRSLAAPTRVHTRFGDAELVSFAYLRDGNEGKAGETSRPVVFLFNGGPIASSLWIHLGAFGPYRTAVPEDLSASANRFALVDNPDSVLDAADLVFVDPADTGFSRRLPGTGKQAFASVEGDASEFAAFIDVWLKQNHREGPPAYIVGESYGTVRAPAMITELAKHDPGVKLGGIMLLGQAVNIVEYSQRPSNIVSFVASLPTIAATAWYHGAIDRKGRSLAQFVGEAERFAKGPYLAALYQGSDLPEAERTQIAAKLEAFSGIPAAYYRAHDLRMTKEAYRVALLKDKGLLIGRMDTRYTAPLTDKGGAPDPSDTITNGFEALWGGYLTKTLGVSSKADYIPMDGVSSFDDWKWGGTSPFAHWAYGDPVKAELARNPQFRVLIGNGLFDTQTTIGAADYLRTQSGWDPARTALRYYFGGHMAYSNPKAAKAMADDLHALVTGAPMAALRSIPSE